MKRILVSLVMMSVALTCFAGGGQESEGEDGPVTITLYDWEASGTDAMLQGFNASHEDIQVEPNYLPAADYETKILTLLAGGIEMDAYMQKNQSHRFAHYANGFIEPLDEYIAAAGTDMSVVAAYNGDIMIDGHYIAVPYRGGGVYTYYNKALFDRLGEPYPSTYVEAGTWNWDTYQEVASRMATGDGEIWGSFMAPWGGHWLVPSLWQTGDALITDDGEIEYDDAAVLEAFAIRRNLESTGAQPELSMVKATGLHYSQAFYEGNLAMLIIGEWFPGMMARGRDESLLQDFTWDEWGIAPLPCDEAVYNAPGVSTFGHVAASSDHKAEAFAVLAYMGLSEEGSRQAADGGLMPAYLSQPAIDSLAAQIPDATSLGYFTSAYPRVNATNNKFGQKVADLLTRLMESDLAGNLTEQELLVEFQAGLEEAIETTD